MKGNSANFEIVKSQETRINKAFRMFRKILKEVFSNFAQGFRVKTVWMRKYGFLYVLMFFQMFSSFASNPEINDVYELEVEAGGCHYQVQVNDQTVLDGKSYQSIQKKIKINDKLTDKGEQLINIHMYRISREMPLKTTKGFVNLSLQKTVKDSVILIKEIKLPTFAYDDDEDQPKSISGSIEFKIEKQDAKADEKEKPVKIDSIQSK